MPTGGLLDYVVDMPDGVTGGGEAWGGDPAGDAQMQVACSWGIVAILIVLLILVIWFIVRKVRFVRYTCRRERALAYLKKHGGGGAKKKDSYTATQFPRSPFDVSSNMLWR